MRFGVVRHVVWRVMWGGGGGRGLRHAKPIITPYTTLQPSKFTKRVFSIMDEDGSGEIDFREFVIALWNYCTLGKAALILFAFDLYDNDNRWVAGRATVPLCCGLNPCPPVLTFPSTLGRNERSRRRQREHRHC